MSYTPEQVEAISEKLQEIIEPHIRSLRENGLEVLLLLCPEEKVLKDRKCRGDRVKWLVSKCQSPFQ